MEDLINFPDRLDERTAFRLNIKRDVGLDVSSHKDGGGVLTVHYRHRRLRAGRPREDMEQFAFPPAIWPEMRKAAGPDCHSRNLFEVQAKFAQPPGERQQFSRRMCIGNNWWSSVRYLPAHRARDFPSWSGAITMPEQRPNT